MSKILHSLILGTGKPLLILHGYFGMGDNWKTLGNKFAEKYQVHLIDQRNHGRSFHTQEFNYELMVDDLLVYIHRHQLEKVNLLGHSMGGKTVMFFAVNHPALVHKLIVADMAPKFYPPHHTLILTALKSVNFSEIKSRNDIDIIFQKYIPEMGIRQFLLKNVYRKTKNEFAYRFNLKSLSDNIDEIGEGLPSFKQFMGETLFLKGENSGYILASDEELIASYFPKNKMRIISNSGHWLHAENPLEFYQNVVDFLKKD